MRRGVFLAVAGTVLLCLLRTSRFWNVLTSQMLDTLTQPPAAPTTTTTPTITTRLHQQPRPPHQVHSVVVFLQLFNTQLLSELRACVANVANVRRFRPNLSIALHVAIVNRSIYEDVRKQFETILGLAELTVLVVENAGADIGQFLQQIPPLDFTGEHDLLLKIHSKSDRTKRNKFIASLCGSTSTVEQILHMFETNTDVGMIGPRGYVRKWPYGMDWMVKEISATWKLIYNGTSPSMDEYLIVEGTWFWSRYAPLVANKELRRKIPEFMQRFPRKYESDYGIKCFQRPWSEFKHICALATEECQRGCTEMYSLERVLPTIIKRMYELEVVAFEEPVSLPY